MGPSKIQNLLVGLVWCEVNAICPNDVAQEGFRGKETVVALLRTGKDGLSRGGSECHRRKNEDQFDIGDSLNDARVVRQLLGFDMQAKFGPASLYDVEKGLRQLGIGSVRKDGRFPPPEGGNALKWDHGIDLAQPARL